MRKSLYSVIIILLYAAFLSLGAECFLELFGAALADMTFGGSMLDDYPRFFLCMLLGVLVALGGLFVTFKYHQKTSKKFGFNKKAQWLQFGCSIVVSMPLIILFDAFFDFLRIVF